MRADVGAVLISLALGGCASPCEDAARRVCERVWFCTVEQSTTRAPFIARYGTSQEECTQRLTSTCAPACVSSCNALVASTECAALTQSGCLATCP